MIIVGGRKFGKEIYNQLSCFKNKTFIFNTKKFKTGNQIVLVEGLVDPITARRIFLDNKDSIHSVILRNPWNFESREFTNLVLEFSNIYNFNIINIPEIYGKDIDFGLVYELFKIIKRGVKKEIEYKNKEQIYVIEYKECIGFIYKILSSSFKGRFKIQGECIVINELIKLLEKKLNKKSKINFIKVKPIEFSVIGYPLLRIRKYIKGE